MAARREPAITTEPGHLNASALVRHPSFYGGSNIATLFMIVTIKPILRLFLYLLKEGGV